MARVVYSLRSPVMGGHSRWNILGDDYLSVAIPEVLGIHAMCGLQVMGIGAQFCHRMAGRAKGFGRSVPIDERVCDNATGADNRAEHEA